MMACIALDSSTCSGHSHLGSALRSLFRSISRITDLIFWTESLLIFKCQNFLINFDKTGLGFICLRRVVGERDIVGSQHFGGKAAAPQSDRLTAQQPSQAATARFVLL